MTIQANFPAIKPSLLLDFANTKQLDSRITYTRASTASFYNGVTTAMAEQNLILQSQTFDSASWGKSSSTVTANTTVAPDGTTTADSIAITSSISVVYADLGANAAVGTYTFSCYVKAGTNNYVALNMQGNTTSWVTAIYDLSTGAVTQTANGSSGLATITTTSITSAGSGWYRCVLTFACTSSVLRYPCVMFAPSATGNTLTTNFGEPSGNTNGNTLIVWGAQLEQRSAVTAYTATTTQAITNYIPVLQTAASGVARFDNNPTTGESLGLLIEESRTNLFTYSAQFDNAAWSKVNATITADTIVSPDGTLNGDKLIGSGSGSIQHYVTRTVNLTGTNTLTVYAKAGEKSFVWVSLGGIGAWFNLSTGAIGTVTSGITAAITSVGNGWYRCSATRTAVVADYYIYVVNSDNTLEFTGNSYDGIYIWGAQLEAGAFATSYIPTVASQVTRAADAASMTGTNFSTWYNQGEGTLYSEAKLLATPGGATYPGIVKISTDSANKIGFWTIPAATSMYFSVGANSTSSADISIAQSPVSNFVKISGVYKVNDFAASVNASTVGTDTSGVIPVVNKMDIGTYDNSWNGTIKKIAYYPLRVTNAQLQSLTS